MSDIFSMCCEFTRWFGQLFGWNYCETQTYLFLLAQPIIYIILGIITVCINFAAIIRYKLSFWQYCVLSVVIVLALSGIVYFLPELISNIREDPVIACERAMADMMSAAGNKECIYEQINYIRYVYSFIAILLLSILVNIPQKVFRKRNLKR